MFLNYFSKINHLEVTLKKFKLIILNITGIQKAIAY